jgi:hypothetical protein
MGVPELIAEEVQPDEHQRKILSFVATLLTTIGGPRPRNDQKRMLSLRAPTPGTGLASAPSRRPPSLVEAGRRASSQPSARPVNRRFGQSGGELPGLRMDGIGDRADQPRVSSASQT